MTAAQEELIGIIRDFTPEQVAKFHKVVLHVKNMSDNQLVFTEAFLEQIFGEVK